MAKWLENHETWIFSQLPLSKKTDEIMLKNGTARPRDTRPRGARTLELHGF